MTQNKCTAFLFLFLVSCGARSRISSTCVTSNHSSEDANKALESYLKKPQAVSSGGYLKVKSNETLSELLLKKEKNQASNSLEEKGISYCTAFFEPEIKAGKKIIRVWTDIDCHKNWPTINISASVYLKGKYLPEIPLSSDYLENKFKAFEFINQGLSGDDAETTRGKLIEKLFKLQESQRPIGLGSNSDATVSFRRTVFENSLTEPITIRGEKKTTLDWCIIPYKYACQNPLKTSIEEFTVPNSASPEALKSFDALLKNYQEQLKLNSIPDKLLKMQQKQKRLITEITQEEQDFPFFALVESLQNCLKDQPEVKKEPWVCERQSELASILKKISVSFRRDYAAEFKSKNAIERNSNLFIKFKDLLGSTSQIKSELKLGYENPSTDLLSIISNLNFEPAALNFHFAAFTVSNGPSLLKYFQYSYKGKTDYLQNDAPSTRVKEELVINLSGRSLTGSLMSIGQMYPFHSLSILGGNETGGFSDPVPPSNTSDEEQRNPTDPGRGTVGVIPKMPDDRNLPETGTGKLEWNIPPIGGINPPGKPKPEPKPNYTDKNNTPSVNNEATTPGRIAEIAPKNPGVESSGKQIAAQNNPPSGHDAEKSLASHNNDMGCK